MVIVEKSGGDHASKSDSHLSLGREEFTEQSKFNTRTRTRMISVLVLFLVFAAGTVADAVAQDNDCPDQCSCLDSYVDCTKLNLLLMQAEVPKWVETLDLSSNKLNESVGQQIKNLPVLQELKLNKNRLHRIPKFVGFGQLEKLSLAHNRIDRITSESLELLVSLQFLDLSRNNIKSIQPNSFPPVNNLKIINLNYNQLASIQRQALDPLENLIELKLNNNRLVAVTTDMFLRLSKLKKLHLNANRLETISALAFKNLVELKILKLRNNLFRQLMAGTFHGLLNISALELDNNQITGISKRWLFNLTSLHTLSLSNNSIDNVERDSWEFVQRLNTLELSNNRLEYIDRNTFEGLFSLRELLLKNNMIKSIAEWSFNNTPNLETLDMSRNEISWTIEDMVAPFSSLKQLRRFFLGANKIKSVNQNAFFGLESVELLDLSDNNLTTIQINAFKDMISLRELLITSKSLLCDCNLKWFHNWLERKSVILGKPVCNYPVWLRGKYLLDLGVNNFTCNDSPKPKIIEEPPHKLLAIRGTNLTLTCTAISTSSDSEMKFVWKRDNVELDRSLFMTSYLHNRSLDDNSTVSSSSLVLSNVNHNHVGEYQCIVTNNYGSTYSIKNNITVGTLPLFKTIPKNVTVTSGSTIRLDCSAVGEPRPQIAWQKDGGNDFPAARERRMNVMPNDVAFFIVNAKTADQGVYSCTAENAVGIVKANATLIVQEAPSFVKPMENKEVVQGMSSVLECMASGSPKPRLKWYKDEQPLVASERHFLAAEDQLLVIVETQQNDAGVYECKMENGLGADSGRLMLAVVSSKTVIMAGVSQCDTIGIVIITIVCCSVGTSIIWLVIIYQTKKYGNICNLGHRGAAANQSRVCSSINNSVNNHVLVEDGTTCLSNYSRNSLLQSAMMNNGPRINLIPGAHFEAIDVVDASKLYKEMLSPAGQRLASASDIYCQQPQQMQLTRISEEIHNADEELSCKDSGNGDSSKGRNPTSSDDDEEEEEENYGAEQEMLKDERKTGRVNIQRNHLNDYLEEDEGKDSLLSEDRPTEDNVRVSLQLEETPSNQTQSGDTNSAVYFSSNKNSSSNPSDNNSLSSFGHKRIVVVPGGKCNTSNSISSANSKTFVSN